MLFLVRAAACSVFAVALSANAALAASFDCGKASAFIFDMDFGSSPTHDTVQKLTGQTGNAVFEVRGFVSPEDGFDQNQCRYVYMLPE